MKHDKLIMYSSVIKSMEAGADDLEKINKYTLEPVTAEDVYTFKVMAGDTGDDDRNFEPFDKKALDDMAKLYIGKTVIKNHNVSDVAGQIGRIYDAEVIQNGDLYELYLKIYIAVTEENTGFIKEIKSGIKKEVSTSTRPEKLICNICGQDNMKKYCPHYPGVTYDNKVCMMTIDGVSECYELSFVTVPAQPRAGATKSGNLIEHITNEKKDIEARNRLLNSYLI